MSELVREDQNGVKTSTDQNIGTNVLTIVANDSRLTRYNTVTLDLRRGEDEEKPIQMIEISDEEAKELREISEDMRRVNRVSFRNVGFVDDHSK